MVARVAVENSFVIDIASLAGRWTISSKRDPNQHVGLVLKRLHEEPVRAELIKGDAAPPRGTNFRRHSKMANMESRASAYYQTVHRIVADVILRGPCVSGHVNRAPPFEGQFHRSEWKCRSRSCTGSRTRQLRRTWRARFSV